MRVALRLPLVCALSLAVTTVAYPQGFTDLTVSSGLSVVPPSSHHGGTGMCAGDFDGDGDEDLIIAADPNQPWWYFRNDGNMTFTERGAASGLGMTSGAFSRGVIAADIDNDGDLDVFACRQGSWGQLFINDGTGVFTEEGFARGLTGPWRNWYASFGDYDRDGWVDLSVATHPDLNNQPGQRNQLYRNLGNGYFLDVTTSAGVDDMGAGFCATFVDFDEDDWPDIYVLNDNGASGPPWLPEVLYRNNGDGTFTDVSVAYNAQPGIAGMGMDFLDVFNDGGLDMYVTDQAPDHLFLVWDPSTSTYTHEQSTFGLTQAAYGQTGTAARGWACHYIDYDADGWQDLYMAQHSVPNLFFRNPGTPQSAGVAWTEMAASLGLDYSGSVQYTSIKADFDNDGRPDFLDRYRLGGSIGLGLKRNDVVGGNYLVVKCVGTVSNRSALGARIVVTAGGLVQRQWVRSGTGYLSGNDLRCHFGLGTATSADIEIRWPSGQVQTIPGAGVNQQLTIVEPQLSFSGTPLPGAVITLDLSIPTDAGLPFTMAIAASNTPPIPLPGGRFIPIAYDVVAQMTLAPGNTILPQGTGILDPAGAASRSVFIPPIPSLTGLTAHATAVTIVSGSVRTVFPESLQITVQ